MRRVVGLCLACWMCGGVREDGGRGALVLSDRVDSGAGVAELQERLLTPYLARHPGLELVQRPIAGRDEYRRALLTALAGEDPPDVFLLDDEDVPRVVDRGVALDLVPYLPRIGVDPARYDQTLVAVFRRGAGLYGLPRGYTPVVVAYNKDLLDRAAIPYPTDDWTWDDFLGVAKQLTRDTDGDGSIDQWGSAFDGRIALWLPWIWAGGGDVLCADGRRASGCLDSRATIEAMRWYAGWMSAGIAPRIRDARDAPGAIARLFASGRLALMTTGHWAIPGLRATVAAGRLHVGFVAIPHRAGVAPATVLYVSGYAVPALTLRRKAAVELAGDLTDSAAAVARAEAGLELPAVAAAARAVAAADALGWDAAFLRAAAHGRPSWGVRVGPWRDVAERLGDLMDRIASTGVDPARAAGSTARELDRLLGATR